MSNIDYSKKYLKYKNKYYNSKYETNLLGGVCEEKYILLSCPEFNGLVDGMLMGNMAVEEGRKFKEEEQKLKNEATANILGNASLGKFVEDLGIEYKAGNREKVEAKIDDFVRSTVQVSSNNFYRGYINWSNYGDKTPNIKMNKETVIRLKGSKVIFFAYFSFNEPTVTSIITQLLFLNSLNHYGVAEINIVLPYFPVGTMERIVGEGEIPTAYSLAHMLNMIPSGASKNNLYVFDIHALCSRFFFHTNTRPVLISMMPDYVAHMNTLTEGTNIVVFPDDGAKKRFEKLLSKDIKTITCSKTRMGDQRVIKIDSGIDNLYKSKELTERIEGDINLFLIDDLVQSGGTIIEAFRGLFVELVKLGFDATNIKCFAVITHAVLPDDKKTTDFFEATAPIKKSESETINHPMNITLITTDSRPERVKQLQSAPYKERVKVLPLTRALLKTFTSSCEVNPYISPFSIN